MTSYSPTSMMIRATGCNVLRAGLNKKCGPEFGRGEYLSKTGVFHSFGILARMKGIMQRSAWLLQKRRRNYAALYGLLRKSCISIYTVSRKVHERKHTLAAIIKAPNHCPPPRLQPQLTPSGVNMNLKPVRRTDHTRH